MVNKRILVVDDNRDITEMVQTMLEGTPYDCVTVNSGRECIDLTKKETFDLILLDMAMPEMSGLDVLKMLKAKHKAGNTNVVLITASPMYTEMDLKKIREEYGAIERVKKPFTDTELLAVIDKYTS
ncbi:MAG TPA: response regulator [Nitrososphaera sp.]|jgi:CheY-like chemotaxis protein|nr:response regulator [Nitrososphaera sp.]